MDPNALYIALFIRDDPPKPNDYHWALYHHINSGIKYHITNEGNGWIPGHGPESGTGILKAFLLVGLIQIATIPSTTSAQETLDRVCRNYDGHLNDNENRTCRTWLLDVLRDLQEQMGVLHGVDIKSLEKEAMDWGNKYAFEACRNIVDPQSATLTNIEVLAYLTANPPRRPPNPPPNSRNWVPSPDLRDHNTVVKEIHNYVTRLSPHLLNYPKYTNLTPAQIQAQAQSTTTTAIPPSQINAPTPLDHALRELVTRLQPYGLTKGEVLMIVNLGVGLHAPATEGEDGEEAGEGGEEEEYDDENAEQQVNGGEDMNGMMEVDGAEEGQGGEGEIPEEDYGALALLDTVIEEREERLSNDDVNNVLAIIRETLGSGMKGSEGEGMDEEG
ncbi:hypothetical protein AKAW_02714 [Aspergillus niger]|uniref:Uncharacterized protein n=1 Tax=Aspergillus niger TaxID=5061 RepID=A0A117DWP3_ASPNG|nr:hypothetical protein AKAW_02714 [Aspergillus niger]